MLGSTRNPGGRRSVFTFLGQNEDILAAFYEAMLAGYAGELTDTITYTRGDGFKVVDEYTTLEDDWHSFGSTTVFFNDRPVWKEEYAGEYPKEVIPFLKKALRVTYERHEFVGGRGPAKFSEGGLLYVNLIEHGSKDNWWDFSGREGIWGDGNCLGFHKYSGLLLLS